MVSELPRRVLIAGSTTHPISTSVVASDDMLVSTAKIQALVELYYGD